MEGKGWFIIYGILALLVIYLFVAQQSQAGRIKQLQADVAQLRGVGQTSAPPATPAASPEPSSSPDLSNALGRDQRREQDLGTISAALNKYQAEKKSYPDSWSQLSPTYLDSIPKDPLSPKYSYRYLKTQTGYKLTAYLETSNYPDDRRDGKADHILTFTEKTQ